ncbi:C-type lectin 37Db [Drosophila eugracilis]|uniref:C-type lectin 37Db n=1 Tax=Drosophila eugracilis TaxID=29029 RepID=UPI001BDA4A27|nr:C-type lectin 37Db [Drosophila eugracilis]
MVRYQLIIRIMTKQVLSVLVLLALALGIHAKNCTSPFSQVGNKCYYVSLEKANWHVADRSCRKLGGELMVLDDQQDKLLITKHLNSLGLLTIPGYEDSVWVGINCLGTSRSFILSKNGSTVPFLDWVPLEPNNYTPEEDCVGFADFNGAYGYHDIECKFQFPFVCQRKAGEDYLCLKKELFTEAFF